MAHLLSLRKTLIKNFSHALSCSSGGLFIIASTHRRRICLCIILFLILSWPQRVCVIVYVCVCGWAFALCTLACGARVHDHTLPIQQSVIVMIQDFKEIKYGKRWRRPPICRCDWRQFRGAGVCRARIARTTYRAYMHVTYTEWKNIPQAGWLALYCKSHIHTTCAMHRCEIQ